MGRKQESLYGQYKFAGVLIICALTLMIIIRTIVVMDLHENARRSMELNKTLTP